MIKELIQNMILRSPLGEFHIYRHSVPDASKFQRRFARRLLRRTSLRLRPGWFSCSPAYPQVESLTQPHVLRPRPKSLLLRICLNLCYSAQKFNLRFVSWSFLNTYMITLVLLLHIIKGKCSNLMCWFHTPYSCGIFLKLKQMLLLVE